MERAYIRSDGRELNYNPFRLLIDCCTDYITHILEVWEVDAQFFWRFKIGIYLRVKPIGCLPTTKRNTRYEYPQKLKTDVNSTRRF